MPTPRTPKLSKATLRDAYRKDLEAAWRWFRTKYPRHEPYAFVLYGVEGGPRLMPQVLSEQGLTEVARRYVGEGYYETLEEGRDGLRYSVADSPHFDEFEERVPTVDALAGRVVEAMDDEEGYELLAGAGIEALKALDAGGVFGKGAQRSRLLLVVITDDTETDWGSKSARRLNPRAVYQRFEKQTEVEGEYKSCEKLAVSPDGRSVYSVGSRENPKARAGSDDEFFSEVVAYDLKGRRLTRRWTFSFLKLGDSGRGVACAPDGKSALVLRAKYSDSTCHTLLMRFAKGSSEPVRQQQVEGECGFFAVSRDGSRVAVSMHRKALHLFDAELRPVRVRELNVQPGGLLFLPSGELLVATAAGVLRLDPGRDAKPKKVLPGEAHRLSMDDAGKLLAVSRWFPMREQKRPRAFGVDLLRLPSFKRLRTVLIPGHRAVTGTLSPDGRLVALEAHEMGKERTFVAVFETATGRELGRRKSDFVRDLAFLRDSRTLLIPDSGYMTGEPIQLWKVPGGSGS